MFLSRDRRRHKEIKMGKWIAIIWTAVISIFLYLIVYSSSKGISDDMQEMLDEEQTEIVASMMEEREKKKDKNMKKGANNDKNSSSEEDDSKDKLTNSDDM